MFITNGPTKQSAKGREDKIRKEVKYWRMVVLKKLERLVHREERRGKGREILEKEQSWIKKIFIKFC